MSEGPGPKDSQGTPDRTSGLTATNIRAVLFDAVGTLFRSRGTVGQVYANVANRHGIEADPEELEVRFQTMAGDAGAPSDRDGWRSLVETVFAVSPPFGDFDAFFADLYAEFRSGIPWRLFPETTGVLEALRAKELGIGLVTSFDDGVLNVLEDLGIRRFFAVVHTSASSRTRKPDPRFFEEASAALGCRPAETLVVGDDPVQDVLGGSRAGMATLLVDRRPGAIARPSVIRDLTGILGFLSGAG